MLCRHSFDMRKNGDLGSCFFTDSSKAGYDVSAGYIRIPVIGLEYGAFPRASTAIIVPSSAFAAGPGLSTWITVRNEIEQGLNYAYRKQLSENKRTHVNPISGRLLRNCRSLGYQIDLKYQLSILCEST
jgi:hypothetical protein